MLLPPALLLHLFSFVSPRTLSLTLVRLQLFFTKEVETPLFGYNTVLKPVFMSPPPASRLQAVVAFILIAGISR